MLHQHDDLSLHAQHPHKNAGVAMHAFITAVLEEVRQEHHWSLLAREPTIITVGYRLSNTSCLRIRYKKAKQDACCPPLTFAHVHMGTYICTYAQYIHKQEQRENIPI